MVEHDEIPVETSEGWRPDASRGERVLVALAAVALLGGALIVGGSFLPKQDPSAVVSSTPQARASPSPTLLPTPIATPVPVELTLTYGVPPSPSPAAPPVISGWIRARVDLPIRPNTTTTAVPFGTLLAGTAAYADVVDDSPEATWVSIVARGGEGGERTGFVMITDGDELLAERFTPANYETSGWFWQIAAGPDGFMAIGAGAGPWTEERQASLFASEDGIVWRPLSAAPALGSYGAMVAWGPVGWLLVADPGGNGDSWMWNSRDGAEWHALGALRAAGPSSLQATERGYLLGTYSRGAIGGGWFSSDAIHWTQTDPALSSESQITATPIGFYAATYPWGPPQAALSSDGLTWSPIAGSAVERVAVAGETMLGIETDPESGEVRSLRAELDGDRLAWEPMADSAETFAGAGVTMLLSVGGRAYAFGVDLASEASLAWTSDGVRWQRTVLPDAFDGPPLLAAAGRRGIVVVGRRWNARGDNPVIWHRSPVGRWTIEPDPILGLADPPSAGDCGRPPRDALEFIQRDAASSAACFSGLPITFRAWSAACDGCYGDSSGSYQVEWLANPTAGALSISPAAGDGGWTAALHPDLGHPQEEGWRDVWLELTGHFGDPAAEGCRWIPPPGEVDWYVYSGTPQVVQGCREQFVVTAVRVVDGP